MSRITNQFFTRTAASVIAVACLGNTAHAAVVVLPPSADATIFEDQAPNQEVTLAGHTEMRIRWQSAATFGRNHPLVKFDLSGLPALAPGETLQVNYARFSFWAFTSDDSGPGWPSDDDFPELAMYFNTSDWSETDATAMPTFESSVSVNEDSIRPDGVTPVKFTAPDTIAFNAAGWLYFDDPLAASLVELWADGTLPNYGIQIRGTGGFTDSSRYLHLFSREGSIAPHLVVDYTIISVPEPASLMLVGLMTTALLVVRRR